jgi:hypothetical protein
MTEVQSKRAAAVFAAALVTALGAALSTAASATPPVIADDLAKRASAIHWPSSHTPDKAILFAHNEIVIAASCEKVWSHIVDARKWPDWYPNSRDVRLVNSNSGVLEKDTRFTWSTFGLPVDSTVAEFVSANRLGWFGKAPDVDAYHTWLLVSAGPACQVVTEEVTNGPAATAWRNSSPGALHEGHEVWLQKLKEVSEK